MPAIRLPPGSRRGRRRAPRADREGRRHVAHRRGGARDRAPDRGVGSGRVVAARPGLGAGCRRDRRGRRHVADRERALGRAIRSRRRGRGRGRQGCVRAREPARAGGSGSPLRDQRGAGALPQSLAREDGAGSARPARRDRPGGRAPGRAGHEVLDARARPRDRAADRGADRHALDHLAAPLPRARPDPGDDPRDRRRPRGARLPPRTPRARGRHHEWWWRLRGAGSRLRLAAAVARSGRSGLQGRRLPVAFRRHPCAAGACDPAHRRRCTWGAGLGRGRGRGRLGATGGRDEADAIGEGCRSEQRRRGRARSGRGRYGARAHGGAGLGGGDVCRGCDDAAEQLADGDLAPAKLGQGGAALVPRDRDARLVRRDDARAGVPARATLRRAEGDRARGGAPPGAAGPVRHHPRRSRA